MKSRSGHILLFIVSMSFCVFFGCEKRSTEIPREFNQYINQYSFPIDYKEIFPAHEGEKLPIPDFIMENQAMEDIQMLEYLLRTSYSGFDYWKYNGIDFESYFGDLKSFIHGKDTVYCYEFEKELSKILKQLRDGHINFIGLGYNHAYRHKSIYYCDVLVEKSDDGLFRVIESQCDMVKKGDRFTEENTEAYLFKTLSSTGKDHYLVGVLSFDGVASYELSFNGKAIKLPFHGSRLKYAKFHDPEPFYIKRKNNIPIVRVTGFADQLYPQMKNFMNSAIDLRDEKTIIINLFYNGGGSSIFPQGFIQNLNSTIQWETYWATLNSPAITQYYAKYDLNSMPDISPSFRHLIQSHQNLDKYYRETPVKSWKFDSTQDQNKPGSYKGKLILLTNRRVLSAGEGMVGVSRSVKNCIVIGENTGGVAQFSSTCGYYLPHSKIIVNLPRQFIIIPDLKECIGYLPDYWLDTIEPVKEVLNWLDDPENYQFKYSIPYSEMKKKINVSPLLPKDVKIIPPGSNVPNSLKIFSGKWSGVWDGVLDNMLVVETIDDNLEVEAIYSWGVAYQWNLNDPGWNRYEGKIEKHTLVLSDETSNTTITYKLNQDGKLNATFQRPGIFSRAILEKVKEKK